MLFPRKYAYIFALEVLRLTEELTEIQYFWKDSWPFMHMNVSSSWLLLAQSESLCELAFPPFLFSAPWAATSWED